MIVYVTLVIVSVLLVVVIYGSYLWYPIDQKLAVYTRTKANSNYEEQIIDLENIPKLKVIDGGLEEYDCSKPKFLGLEVGDYTEACFNACGGNGTVKLVTDTDQIYVDNVQLKPGYWCFKQTILPCNSKFGRLLISDAGAVCSSRFPNLIGGPSANEIVACQGSVYREAGQLLDHKDPKKVFHPETVDLTDENEMFEGKYRFECQYPNIYQRLLPNPFNRFVPIADPCVGTHPRLDSYYDLNQDACICNGKSQAFKCSLCPEIRISCIRDASLFTDSVQPCPDRSLISTECTGIDQATTRKNAPDLPVLNSLYKAYQQLNTPRDPGSLVLY